MKQRWLAAALMLSAFAAGGAWISIRSLRASQQASGAEEGATMILTKKRAVTIPPIDAAAPARVETATFAMG
jgi:hypothetical protein